LSSVDPSFKNYLLSDSKSCLAHLDIRNPFKLNYPKRVHIKIKDIVLKETNRSNYLYIAVENRLGLIGILIELKLVGKQSLNQNS